MVAALPSLVIPLGIRAAAAAGKPWVDLTWPANEELPALRQLVDETGILVVPGCGVEPGLTEIMARWAAEKLDRVDELHIKCGGIQAVPSGPLAYKIVFGGHRLPLRELPARIAEEGALRDVPRYSGVETFTFPGVGEVEAWHEGFMPWLLELEALQGLKLGTQKTVRWPGFGAKATLLRELGLLSLAPCRRGRRPSRTQARGGRRPLPARQDERRRPRSHHLPGGSPGREARPAAPLLRGHARPLR